MNNPASSSGRPACAPAGPRSRRLLSLDVFRGATIAGMVLVNTPGNGSVSFAQLRHAAWNGWTFTDMIFPFFLFAVGVAMTFSFARRVDEGADRLKLMGHVVRRAAVIFALGLIVNGFPFGLIPGTGFSLSTWRIPGVLQRIAVCYLIVSTIFLFSRLRAQVLWTAGLLAAYWLAVMLIPVPGYGAGFLEPQGNLLWYVDSTLLTGHTWVWAPAPGFDPEGIISTIPAISTMLFGVLAGHWLRSQRPGVQKAGGLIVAGVPLLVLGLLLDTWLPINKNMWTSSYVLLMAGWASGVLGILYWAIDVRDLRRWATPFVILGMNAIAVYVASELLVTPLWALQTMGPDGKAVSLQEFVYRTWFLSVASPPVASLLFALAFDALMFLLAWALWKKHWFLKV
jgi:predicted acyltransferase